MKNVKYRFLAAAGYVCKEGESPEMAFNALLKSNPDMFPVPREYESLLMACDEVATKAGY
jgi:hypothetical protein